MNKQANSAINDIVANHRSARQEYAEIRSNARIEAPDVEVQHSDNSKDSTPLMYIAILLSVLMVVGILVLAYFGLMNSTDPITVNSVLP